MRPVNHRPMTGAVFPAVERSLIGDLALILFGSLLLVLASRIEIPAWPVPLTGQTLGLFLIAAVLGPARSGTSVTVYLAMGAAGLPVFSAGATGLTAFTGPTAGYIAGFLPAVLIVGALSERGWSGSAVTAAAAMLLGSLAIYIPGLLWLSRFTGASKCLELGMLPFIPGDILKILVVSLLIPRTRSFLLGRGIL